MVFTSPIFLFLFLPLFITLYFGVRERYKNYLLIISSLIFYFWAEPKFIFVALASLVIDWYLGNRIFIAPPPQKKIWLALSVSINVALLLYFKYTNFIVQNLNDLLLKAAGATIHWTHIALPLGLSFIVFEKITYSFDIYKGTGKPAKTLSLYLVYTLLFPKLIAGPIVKYHEIDKQLERRKILFPDILNGIFRFAIGLAKKVWVANTLGTIVDRTFHLPPSSLTVFQSWMGILCFTFQIYFDFSGYTDMAIGLTRIAGFRIKENFNYPYVSVSFTEFWRRWHISLSTWIREYLYIPLGGNRKSNARTYLNLWLCFIICGFWHGANWPFVFWGFYHGIFLILDKVIWLDFSQRLPKICNRAITFLFVVIGWVFFRSPSVQYAFAYLSKMFSFSDLLTENTHHLIYVGNEVILLLGIAFLVSFLPARKTTQDRYERFLERALRGYHAYLLQLVSFFLIAFSVVKISTAHFAPFIYFRF